MELTIHSHEVIRIANDTLCATHTLELLLAILLREKTTTFSAAKLREIAALEYVVLRELQRRHAR
ncbi:MAG: hypothetical protein KCHDKBKB_02993 [Elusimicrobia bacterium]|nr:hypothetical protein [Elusimicrobiota bacterium]